MLGQSQKGIVHLGLLILLLLGLVAGVYLVQHPQIFKSKATGDLIWLVDENGNRLSPKGEGVYEVPSREIRIKINQPDWSSQPQSRLPNLVTTAYAQSSQCDGNIYSCSDIKCPDGNTAPGTGCYETGGDSNNRYSTECLRNCPVNPASNVSPSVAPNTGSDNSSATTCAYKNGICATDSGRTSDGRSCSSWLKGGPYPDCNNIYYYCFSEDSCRSAAITPNQQDISSPPVNSNLSQPPRREPEVVEVTQKTRISLMRSYIQKDSFCESNSDLGSTCKELTFAETSLSYLSWTLPDKEGEYTIYVGFISNKDNYKETSLGVRYTTTPTAVSSGEKEQLQDKTDGFLRLFSFQKGKSGETKIKGKLVVLHGDNLHTQQSFRNFLIQHVGQDGVLKYYNLKFKESNVRLPQSGDEIELEGNLEGQIFTVNRVLTQVTTPATTSTQDDSGYVVYPPTLAASGGKKALLTYVRWSDNSQQYFSGDVLRDSILENPAYIASSSKFLRDASFGNNLHIAQLDFSQTEITVPVSGMTCAPLGLGLANILTAIDTASRLGRYDIYIYLLAGPNNCPFNEAVPALPPVRIFMNNYFDPQIYSNISEQQRREFFSEAITHETGHTFGLQHASRIDCKNNGSPVPISRSCQIVEYGDPSGVMGNRYTFFGATQDFYLGWLPQASIDKLPYSSERVVYEKTITAAESSVPGKKLLAIQGLWSGLSFLPFNDPRSPLRSTYYISFRKKTQSVFTSNPYPMPDDFYQGATIQIGPDSSSGVPDQVFLINTSAGLQGDYTLKNSKNFYDPEQRILIEQVRKDDDTVTVRVTYNSDSPPSLPPISGKLKIIANGQKYKDVWISVFKIKSENPVEFGDLLADYRSLGFAAALPTDQDQEISFSIPNLTESKYALVPNLMTEGGRHISARSAEICPSSPAGPFSCLVNTGATDLTFTLTISP